MTRFATPRGVSRPISRGISRPITGATLLDADAAAYIAAIEGYGETVTAAQKSAIDTFFRAGKSAGWYSSLARLYLPIWGAAAPNARCIVSGTNGTFRGGVTHAAGYIQGDGATGDFLTDGSPTELGVTLAGGGIFALCLQAPSGTSFGAMGGLPGATDSLQLFHIGNDVRASLNGPPTLSFTGTRAAHVGLWVSSRTSLTDFSLYQRTAAGFATRDTDTTSVAGNSVSATDLTFMSQAGNIESDGRFGVFGAHLGLSEELVEDLTEAMKELWETCTGLSLP